MNGLWAIPVSSIVSLRPEKAIDVIRTVFRAEIGYAKLDPSVLTISDRLMTPDGGIDAEIDASQGHAIPVDCIFRAGITGFQIKSGTAFKPWTEHSIRKELLNREGDFVSEVKRIIHRNGHYKILCTGHDLTPEQRNDAKDLIERVLAEKGFAGYEGSIDVLGASQIAEFAERYPGTASLLIGDPIQEAWTLDEWRQDAHMANALEESPEQAEIIVRVRAALRGDIKHIRILGEAGLGKTRIVLESIKDEAFAPYVLYFQHGSQFGQTRLFRQLLKSGHDKPLILVIDELPEKELSEIWRHLKPRCGHLKLVTMDHGLDKTHDEEIERINAPYLPDDAIKRILAYRVGESPKLDRWVSICGGSPRVAQAVADNLSANPADILKEPTTISLWPRFLHGYGNRDETSARQIDCVALHLALFNRFGYEAPVNEEALHIAEIIRIIDPTIGWARFQEIVQDLRARRVLQGSRTLFFVPKALHIYLWRQFWERYGRGFDFTRTFSTMPESLQVWFMNMFKYAEGVDTAYIIEDILDLQGIFSQREFLISAKGSQFLSVLAEAHPSAVLKLLEATIGGWTNEELLEFRENRQQFVWTLEKIAVWSSYTVRAMQILTRLALNENASNSNNSKGTLLSLFRIGPEWAATESSPMDRLVVFRKLLQAPSDAERQLALDAANSSLNTQGMAYRIVGPEYQGLKERAKLWIPETYGDWRQTQLAYFETLVKETDDWPPHLRPEVCNTLLNAVDQQILTPQCTELAFQVLDGLINDQSMAPEKLINFFRQWREYRDKGQHPEVTRRLRILNRRYTRRDLITRFNRYVLYVDWLDWDDDYRMQRGRPRTRAKSLVKALARRIALSLDRFSEVSHLINSEKGGESLFLFGEQIALNDPSRSFLPQITELVLKTNQRACLYGYLSAVRQDDPELYGYIIDGFLNSQETVSLGAQIVLSSPYDDDLFVKCLSALDKGWISPQHFASLRYGRSIDTIPQDRLRDLFHHLIASESSDALGILVELFSSTLSNGSFPFDSEFVLEVISRSLPGNEGWDVMRSYHWKTVAEMLIKWDRTRALPLLDILLTKMGEVYSLTYDSIVEPLAIELVQTNPSGAWMVIKGHFERGMPNWRLDIVDWLKGGIAPFETEEHKAVIAELPLQEILDWIDKDPEARAGLIAHAAPRTLDDVNGGQITRELLRKYGQFEAVRSGISAIFHSGGWTGPRSAYLRRKREDFRRWLAAGFDYEVTRWIESEIESLDRGIEREEIDEERARFD